MYLCRISSVHLCRLIDVATAASVLISLSSSHMNIIKLDRAR